MKNTIPRRRIRQKLRKVLNEKFPDMTFYFQASDIVNQILNFGLPAPIDIQMSGRQFQENYAVMEKIKRDVATVPGAADVHINQVVYAPELHVDVDRTRAQLVGLTESNVANSMLFALAGSGQASPNFWLNPQNGVSYQVVVQTPQYKIDSVDALKSIPVTSGATAGAGGVVTAPQLLNNVAVVTHGSSPSITNHYNVQPVFDVFVNTQGRDLGGVAKDIDKVLDKYRDHLPRGSAADGARTGEEHERVVHRAGPGNDLRGAAGVPADGGELPELA